MRRDTKKRIMALTIVFIFGMSSVAFVIVAFSGPPIPEFKPLNSFVVDGEVEPEIASQYYQWGYTFLKFYYADPLAIETYVDQLPNLFLTSNDKQQLIVEKIPNNETYVYIININTDDTIYNITEEAIHDSLCNNLVSIPVGCLEFDLEGMFNTTATDNATDDANATDINNTNTSY